ncbi:MAG: cell division protein FtsX [Marinilabiliales bacterium]|nr:MAG: cell division protein FtsX [Marinilabiliales bacterium]
MQIGALIPFSILAYINDLNKVDREFLRSYGTWQFPTYFLLPTNYNEKDLANKLVDRFLERWPDWEDPLITLRPLKDLYFANHSSGGNAIYGSKNNVKLFFAIGIFIILIACINFINLTTAKASQRATEVGIRKAHGSYKRQLISQFLLESILLTFISFLFAITLVQVLLPYFNNLVQKEISFLMILHVYSIIISIFGILTIGFIAGTYPAFYLTAFSPIKVLKGEKTKGKSATLFRRILIVLQFTISVALIICTLTVYKQIHFLHNKDMGFNKENIVAVYLNDKIKDEKESFKQALLTYPEIKSVSFSAGIIGTMGNTESFDFNSDGERTSIQLHSIDPTFLDQFEIELIEGRNFSFDHNTDAKRNIILNEEAVKVAGLELGKTAGTIFHRDRWYFTALPSKECEIIGVVKNFNYRSLHSPIGPQGLAWNDDWHWTVNIKITEGRTEKALEIIETVYKEFSEDIPFEYRFVDDHIDNLYKSEKRLGKFFVYFAIIAIIIAMLGLFGLAAFIAESRTKEIGIRKALGSSITKIIFLITQEFIKWVVVANFIAIPIAYYGMNKWLQTFAYKTKITVDIYLISFVISLFIAFITVFYQSLRAARSNPADSLRYE